MIGVYFSGTGNTKHCIERFCEKYETNTKCISIEDDNVIEEIKKYDMIIFAYPIYYSSLPKIINDFIKENKNIWKDKKIFIITTMGLFSGDGAGCSARLFKKFGAEIIGGAHIKMPDCIGDVKALKKPLEENRQIVRNADKKIDEVVEKIKNNIPSRDGLDLHNHIAGLFGQRLWFCTKTKNYTDKLKIDSEKCMGCGKCVEICPMENISLKSGKATPSNSCTMCYRCVNNCPKQAITLIGKEVIEQSKIENYL